MYIFGLTPCATSDFLSFVKFHLFREKFVFFPILYCTFCSPFHSKALTRICVTFSDRFHCLEKTTECRFMIFNNVHVGKCIDTRYDSVLDPNTSYIFGSGIRICPNLDPDPSLFTQLHDQL